MTMDNVRAMQRCFAERWQSPIQGVVKCNLNANWRSSTLLTGGSWLIKDHSGSVLYHARDAFTYSTNCIMAELRVIMWAMNSFRDLHIKEVAIASECSAAMEAISKPTTWPRCRILLSQIVDLRNHFEYCSFEVESMGSNSIAREIAKNVTRDGRFQSYLALGGPSWLHDRIAREAS